MNGTTVLLTAIGYVSFLFLIAWWGDGAGRRFLSGRSRAFVYALSLAVYCTSWTYYGSVGLASAHGLDFLPIYIGPILVIGFGAPFIARIANLARAQNVSTVADFVSARYGKSQPVAAVAALSKVHCMKIAMTCSGWWRVTEFGDGGPALPGFITCHFGRPWHQNSVRPAMEPF